MTPKAVFWDMDGTLIDSEPLHQKSLEAALTSVGIQPPQDLHDRIVGVAAFPVYQMLRDEMGLQLPFDEWIVRKYDHYFRHVHTLKARPGAVEIFRQLHAVGMPQVIVSNSDRLVVGANIGAIGLNWPALRSISRNDVRNPKPDPEPYLRAAWLVGVEPAECCVVEDSWTGAMAGVEAGMKTLQWVQELSDPPSGAILLVTPDEVRYHLGLPQQPA